MPSNDARDTNPAHLHPAVRGIAQRVVDQMKAEGHPFEIFEGSRTPQRQAYLYASGRTRPGPIVTRAMPWFSYHQYGLAVDLVLRINGQWSWSEEGDLAAAWVRMNDVGRANGLEPLSWEKPHLQLAGTTVDRLRAGDYPAGGDEDWADHLEALIAGWPDQGSVPPPPASAPTRPPIMAAGSGAEDDALAAANLPAVGETDWHGRFGGREWRYDGSGIYLRDVNEGQRPLRSPGAPATCRAIWEAFGTLIVVFARKYAVPPEIIMMTIATEAGAYRHQGFTGPATFRWEAHVKNTDVQPQTMGDYSAGPMQTLGSTARWVIKAQSLPYHPFQVAPVYATRPIPAPDTHPLYDAATNLDIGTAEIKQRLNVTGIDPILVAAAFNSGGVRSSTANAWHLATHGNHLDRAAQWFGDACAVLKEAGVR